MPNSTITQNLLDAYGAAEYHVDAVPPFILKIGIFSNKLMRLYESTNSNSAAFITAYNPYSNELLPDVNEVRNQALEILISSMRYPFVRGAGKCADDDGIGEVSLLILGMDIDVAGDIGKQFEQNAIVWCAGDAIPQLILLK
jgi:hypothetical protein